MASYALTLRTDDGGQDERTYDHQPTTAEIKAACREFAEDGDWGDDGAQVDVSWTLSDGYEEEIDDGCESIQIAADHTASIRRAGGDPTCEHDWTGEGHGGCRENPGVMAVGGTSLAITEHCTRCGLIRRTLHRGAQRNPGQPLESVSYEQPESAE